MPDGAENSRWTRVGNAKADDVDQYVGRGNNGENIHTQDVGEYGWLGNPFVPVDWATNAHLSDSDITVVPDRETAIEEYRREFTERVVTDREFREAVRGLSGDVLGCWCRTLDEDKPACHGDTVAAVADQLALYDHIDPLDSVPLRRIRHD